MKAKPASQPEISLYCLIGEAICSIQHVEDALSHAITLKKHKKHSRLEADQLLEDYRSYTFGRAIKVVKQSQLYPDEIQEEFESFLLERNWLVHKCMPQNRDDMQFALSRNKLFDRIKNISNQARHLQCIIEEDLMCFSEEHGVDMSRVRKAIEDYHTNS